MTYPKKSAHVDYVLVGDYYIPDLILDKPKAGPEEQRSIGKICY